MITSTKNEQPHTEAAVGLLYILVRPSECFGADSDQNDWRRIEYSDATLYGPVDAYSLRHLGDDMRFRYRQAANLHDRVKDLLADQPFFHYCSRGFVLAFPLRVGAPEATKIIRELGLTDDQAEIVQIPHEPE